MLQGEMRDLEKMGLFNQLALESKELTSGPSLLSVWRTPEDAKKGDHCLAFLTVNDGEAVGIVRKTGNARFALLSAGDGSDNAVGLSVTRHGEGGDVRMAHTTELYEGSVLAFNFSMSMGA